MRRQLLAALVLLALGGCGGSSGKPTLTVSAAASLKAAFTAYGQQFNAATVRFSFAGSDMLAAQIEQGARPDVFASANTKLPDLLYRKRLSSKPTVFAANRLVIAVPAGSSKVRTVADLGKPGVRIAIGSATVPIGSYTRTVLSHLPPSARQRILSNVRSQEPDVTGIVGKLTQHSVDAGFTYVTDVKATKGALKAIILPASLRPIAAYGVVIVNGTKHRREAQRFITGLLTGAGRAKLARAGFLPGP